LAALDSTEAHGASARHASTLGRANLDFADGRDVERFIETLARFERGELGADEWRAFRLVNGTYGQRQEGELSMLRVKIPQGILRADQLERIADVARDYARGFVHITTRQNIQYHFVRLSQMGEVLAKLADVGLTTREACGNAVRNVTTSPSAGVAADERFDPVPYAEGLTRFFSAASAVLDAAAQVQDRVQRRRQRSLVRGHQRPRVSRARRRARRPRVSHHGRWGDGDHVPHRPRAR
jgi:sulfite reductase beta subunit-like hemoprotein